MRVVMRLVRPHPGPRLRQDDRVGHAARGPRRDRARPRGLLGRAGLRAMLAVDDLEVRYGRIAAVRGHRPSHVERRRDRRPRRPERRRQDDHALGDRGLVRPTAGDDRILDGARSAAASAEKPSSAGHRARARGPPHLRDADRRREPRCSARPRAAIATTVDAQTSMRACSSGSRSCATAPRSGRQALRRRAAAARDRPRAARREPRLLLLDEPSLGLAPLHGRPRLRDAARRCATTGVTILLVEQNAQRARSSSPTAPTCCAADRSALQRHPRRAAARRRALAAAYLGAEGACQ